jgi:uncharacterized membrane protein
MSPVSEAVTDVSSGMMGLTSLAIGVAEFAAPEQVQKLMGLEDRPGHRGVLRVLGLRELMHGVGLLAGSRWHRHQTSGLKARVLGDLLDSALLAMAARRTKDPAKFAAVATAVSVIGVLDLLLASRTEQR